MSLDPYRILKTELDDVSEEEEIEEELRRKLERYVHFFMITSGYSYSMLLSSAEQEPYHIDH